jgi:hypothetical protein
VLVEFDSIASSARLWVYQIDRALRISEEEVLLKESSLFISSWTAHGSGLKAAVRIVAHRLLIISADESHSDVSGCSIDSKIVFLKEIQAKLGIDLFGRGEVLYFQNDDMKSMDLSDFRSKIEASKLSLDTYIVDTTIKYKGELENDFIIPVKDSWLMRILKVN